MTQHTLGPMRRFRFTKYGLAENPVGAQIVTDAGKLYDVIGVYRRFGYRLRRTTRPPPRSRRAVGNAGATQARRS